MSHAEIGFKASWIRSVFNFFGILDLCLLHHYNARAYDIFLNGLILRQNGKSQSPLIYIFNHACNWQKHFLFVVDVDQKLSQQLWIFEIDSAKHMPTDVSLSYNIYQNKLGIKFIQIQLEFWIIFRRLVWHKIMPLN